MLASPPLTLCARNHGRAAGPFRHANEFAAFLIVLRIRRARTRSRPYVPVAFRCDLAELFAAGVHALTDFLGGGHGSAPRSQASFCASRFRRQRARAGGCGARPASAGSSCSRPVPATATPPRPSVFRRRGSRTCGSIGTISALGRGAARHTIEFIPLFGRRTDPDRRADRLRSPHQHDVTFAAEEGLAGLCALPSCSGGSRCWCAARLSGAARGRHASSLSEFAPASRRSRAGHLTRNGVVDGLPFGRSLYGARLGGDPQSGSAKGERTRARSSRRPSSRRSRRRRRPRPPRPAAPARARRRRLPRCDAARMRCRSRGRAPSTST